MNWKLEQLKAGKTIVTKEKGNSMAPLLFSGQEHTMAPATWATVKVDDIVYCRVAGTFYTHFVKAIDPRKGCLIGNNKGRINGWTKQIFGKVISKGSIT